MGKAHALTKELHSIFDKFFKLFGTHETTNFDLIRWAKKLKIKPFYYAMTNEIKKLPSRDTTFYAIINYQNSSQPGSHHVGFVCSGKRYYFDSYGFEPQKQLIKKYSPMRAHNYEIQKFNTSLCGQLALLVVYLLKNGYEYEDIVLALQDYHLFRVSEQSSRVFNAKK